MEIKVLGPGCAKCITLNKLVAEVVEELCLDASVEKVDDIMKIMEYGIMRTPGLVINGKIVLSGRVPSKDELKKIIQHAQS